MVTWVMFLAVGILIGIGVGLYVSKLDDAAKRTQDSLSRQLAEKDSELTAYKDRVNNHFMTTASLVNNLTESYRAVHEHLSQGANTLCKDNPDVQSIPFEEQRMVAEIEPASDAVGQPVAEAGPVESGDNERSEITAAGANNVDLDNSVDSAAQAAPDSAAEHTEQAMEAAASDTKQETEHAVAASQPGLEQAPAENETDTDVTSAVVAQADAASEIGQGNDENESAITPDTQSEAPVEAQVSDIEKSRIEASRMVH